MEMVLQIVLLLLGFVALIKGADLFVDGSSSLAAIFKVPSVIIGLTIVALGTSLPELVTSVVAAKKGNSDIALGNIVGSNIFNILFILGTTTVILPINVDAHALIDQIILLGVTITLAITAFTGKKLSRIEGATYLLLYVGYAVYLFLR
jgi:cation:H+ antiporter